VTESDGPDWGCHDYDVNLALGNLLAVNAATEATWTRCAHHEERPTRQAPGAGRSPDSAGVRRKAMAEAPSSSAARAERPSLGGLPD
jgi:hypothetical protein